MITTSFNMKTEKNHSPHFDVILTAPWKIEVRQEQ